MFYLVQAPTKEGLAGVERTRRIRRTATKKRASVFKKQRWVRRSLRSLRSLRSRDHPQQSDAQRTPISLVRAREYQALGSRPRQRTGARTKEPARRVSVDIYACR